MAHDPFDLSRVPPDVVAQARRALDEARAAFGACPPAGAFFGWWVEAHNPGCLALEGIPSHMRPAELAARFDAFAVDGVSFLMGDPTLGAFVTTAPLPPPPPLLPPGLEGWGLGEVREKVRVPIAEGERVAADVRAQVEPLAERMFLVGSIRRGRPEIADVEFVVLPKDVGEFDRAVRAMGFEVGEKRRKYTGAADGLKVELYVAQRPEELGALVLAYTGDWLMNVAMRSKAKRMGYKMDQYGVFRGKKPVLQSLDEREFFDFLGMEWHEPEERSLAARQELRDMVRDLRAVLQELAPEERALVEEASAVLKTRRPLPHGQEMALRIVHAGRFGEREGGTGASLGAEELVELGGFEEPWPGFDLEEWRWGPR